MPIRCASCACVNQRSTRGRIHNAAVISQKAYGCEVRGCPPTVLADARAAQAAAYGRKSGACTTTFLALRARGRNAAVDLQWRFIGAWLHTWRQAGPALKDQIREDCGKW